MATATPITADQVEDDQAAEFVLSVDSKIIPSVDELVDAAIKGGNIIEKEKIASVHYSDEADIIEGVAAELESWIKVAAEKEEEGSLADYQEKKAQIFKMAVIGTIFNTLDSLDENGHLDRLIEKKAGYLGSFVKRFGARTAQKAQKTKSLRGAAATSQRGARAAKIQQAASSVKAKGITPSTVGRGTKGERMAKREAVAAKKQTRGVRKELAATQTSKKRLAVGLTAAGVGGAGLAYSSGSSQNRKPRYRY